MQCFFMNLESRLNHGPKLKHYYLKIRMGCLRRVKHMALA